MGLLNIKNILRSGKNMMKNMNDDYKDLVSVIIPCYNSEKVIKNALDSLARQTYKNIEIIIVNDGSKDNTSNVIYEYLNKFKLTANVYNQINEGVSVARNKGLEVAKGEYITFLDSDDMYSENFISDLVFSIKKHDADTAFCFWTKTSASLENSDIINEYLLTNLKLMQAFMYKKPYKISFFNFLYKKEIIDKYAISFPRGIKYGEDNEFCWKYLAHVSNAVLVDKKMYWYYDNPSSAMHTICWENTMALKVVDNVADYLKENKHPFYSELNNYLYVRTCWALAKDFARYGDKKLFNRFVTEENLAFEIKKLIQSNNKMLSFSSRILSINPNFFYYMIRLYKILSNILKCS